MASRFRSKLPILRFVGLFALFMGLAYACEITPPIRENVFPGYLRHNARVLLSLGVDTCVTERTRSWLMSPDTLLHFCKDTPPADEVHRR
ncbi:MAG: hypothetical protein JSU63_20165 [Phycisphaerales bacterium]|nr:MAG: hypothetical protein JSU63_20165 [Phycisphaerales bacterium]